MKPRLLSRLALMILPLAIIAAAHAGIIAGASVYTKRFETTLLTEPQPLAPPAAKVALGRKFKVNEVRGVWLRVSDGSTSGWVFSGNVADTKPVEIKGLDGLPVAASQTTATAAARPLAPAAEDYASRRNLGDASGDLNWLLTECHTITEEDLVQFLQDQKKGEYQ